MDYEISDLLNELGSSSIPLPDIERKLVEHLGSFTSREEEARSFEDILADWRIRNLRDAATYDERVGGDPRVADIYRHISQGFRNTASRAAALLERLARNPD